MTKNITEVALTNTTEVNHFWQMRKYISTQNFDKWSKLQEIVLQLNLTSLYLSTAILNLALFGKQYTPMQYFET